MDLGQVSVVPIATTVLVINSIVPVLTVSIVVPVQFVAMVLLHSALVKQQLVMLSVSVYK